MPNNQYTRKIVCLFLVLACSSSGKIMTEVKGSDSQLNIIDYNYDGLWFDSFEYYTVWNRAGIGNEMWVNLSILEFVDHQTTAINVRLEVFPWGKNTLQSAPIAFNLTDTSNNHELAVSFSMTAETIYIIKVSNEDPVDSITYNISYSTPSFTNFYYTEKFQIGEGPYSPSITSITWFGDSDPYLYHLEAVGDHRAVIFMPVTNRKEYYFLLENNQATMEMFIGFVGMVDGIYFDTPQITGYFIDFEDYGEKESQQISFFTISNESTGFSFVCEEGHKYSLWVTTGELELADLYLIVNTFGEGTIFFEAFEDRTSAPKDSIYLLQTLEDPWVVERRFRRWIIYSILGGGGGLSTLVIIGIIRRRR